MNCNIYQYQIDKIKYLALISQKGYISVKQFCVDTSCSRTALYRVFNERVSYITAKRYADLLGVDVNEIIK